MWKITEMRQPQLSSDLIRIMEQRLSAIEHRTGSLLNLINQVILITVVEIIIGLPFIFSFCVFFWWWYWRGSLWNLKEHLQRNCCYFVDVEWRQPEASPAEYARANKELRKLSGCMDLIADLRTQQKVPPLLLLKSVKQLLLRTAERLNFIVLLLEVFVSYFQLWICENSTWKLMSNFVHKFLMGF